MSTLITQYDSIVEGLADGVIKGDSVDTSDLVAAMAKSPELLMAVKVVAHDSVLTAVKESGLLNVAPTSLRSVLGPLSKKSLARLLTSLKYSMQYDIDRVRLKVAKMRSEGYTLQDIEDSITGMLESSKRAGFVAKSLSLDTAGRTVRAASMAVGIERFLWLTSNDGRVSGNPTGLYPDADVSCYHIAKENGGVYTWKEGATYQGKTGLFPKTAHYLCRCNSKPYIKGA